MLGIAAWPDWTDTVIVSVPHMKTVVLQSYRTFDVPDWIQRCLHSVKAWAANSAFIYEFIGDELFDLIPNWYRLKAAEYMPVTTDLARLYLMRRFLLDGFSRALWIDADVIMFAPNKLTLDDNLSLGFSKETWIRRLPSGELYIESQVNNSVCLFQLKSISALENYIQACLTTVERLPILRDQLEVGTRLLTDLHRKRALPLLRHFGLLPPCVLDAIIDFDHELLTRFMLAQGEYLYAANLCHFFRKSALAIKDNIFDRVISTLLNTEGRILNDLPVNTHSL